MFIVLLTFSSTTGRASQFMESHNEWINAVLMTAYFCWSAAFSPIGRRDTWRTIRRWRTFKPCE